MAGMLLAEARMARIPAVDPIVAIAAVAAMFGVYTFMREPGWIDASVLAAHSADFPKIPLYTIDDVFGGWTKAQQVHFSDGGMFDQIYQPGS